MHPSLSIAGGRADRVLLLCSTLCCAVWLFSLAVSAALMLPDRVLGRPQPPRRTPTQQASFNDRWHVACCSINHRLYATPFTHP